MIENLEEKLIVINKTFPICPIESYCPKFLSQVVLKECPDRKVYSVCPKYIQYANALPITFEELYNKAEGIITEDKDGKTWKIHTL